MKTANKVGVLKPVPSSQIDLLLKELQSGRESHRSYTLVLEVPSEGGWHPIDECGGKAVPISDSAKSKRIVGGVSLSELIGDAPAYRLSEMERIVIDDPERLFQHLKDDLKDRPAGDLTEQRLRGFRGKRVPLDLADYCAIVEKTHGITFTFYLHKSKPWISELARAFVIAPDGRDTRLWSALKELEGVSWKEFSEKYRLEEVPESYVKSKTKSVMDALHMVKTFFGVGKSDFTKSFFKNYLNSFIPGVMNHLPQESPDINESITEVIRLHGRINTALGFSRWILKSARDRFFGVSARTQAVMS